MRTLFANAHALACVLCLGLLLPAAPAGAQGPLPPLAEPASGTHLPGKFIWADLFSSDLERSRDFLTGLLGWEWRRVDARDGPRYGIFFNRGLPVAGLAQHRPDGPETAYARWVHYVSVADVDAVLARALTGGAEVMLAPREVADRGRFAILADPEKAPVGLLASAAGDPGDYRAEPGEWLWHQLFARDPDAAAAFYRDLLGYAVYPPEAYPELVDTILASDGYARAGVARLAEDADAVPQWLGLVRVDDLVGTLARVEALGGTVLVPPSAELADGDVALVADPLGAPLGLVQREDAR